jgi:hypothetical protein
MYNAKQKAIAPQQTSPLGPPLVTGLGSIGPPQSPRIRAGGTRAGIPKGGMYNAKQKAIAPPQTSPLGPPLVTGLGLSGQRR